MKERFCVTCGHNYDSCESIYEAHELHTGDLPTIGHPLCPKCCGDVWNIRAYPDYVIKKVKK